MRLTWTELEGRPHPLGVSRAEDGALNFALYSKHATAVRLLLFRDGDLVTPVLELTLDPLRHRSRSAA